MMHTSFPCGSCFEARTDGSGELLRCVLARAYEKRQPLPFRLVKAVKDYIGPRTPRKPVIEGLSIIEKEQRRGLGAFQHRGF
jgi:hypothetical protein